MEWHGMEWNEMEWNGMEWTEPPNNGTYPESVVSTKLIGHHRWPSQMWS